MTSLRTRILSLLLLAFAAVPVFAQDGSAPTLGIGASMGCLGAGILALIVVGAISWSREAQDIADQAAANEAKPTAGSSSASSGH